MFEPDTTLKLNLAALALAAIVFGYVFFATRSQPAIPVAVIPTQAPPTRVAQQATATPLATLSPTSEPTLTPTVPPSATATVTPAPPTATATAEPVVLHTVAAGEILSAIALRYGVSIDAILAANDLDDPNRLEVGQVLRIPVQPTPTP